MLNVTQGPANDFDFPPPSGQMGPNNSVFTIGDVLNLRWHTQFSQVNLIQRQNENDTEILLACSIPLKLVATSALTANSESRNQFLHMEGHGRSIRSKNAKCFLSLGSRCTVRRCFRFKLS
jgi:hypothetical protein